MFIPAKRRFAAILLFAKLFNSANFKNINYGRDFSTILLVVKLYTKSIKEANKKGRISPASFFD
jgi:hypothetical protein